MITYQHTVLSNGLRVIVHEDASTPLAAINILYDVGARDEDPGRTGFAHLFEHLMFGGSENIPDYDTPLQLAGGENNAFTNNDITNYYLTLPVTNIETGFWLESDRMRQLAFSQQSLDVQRSVVVEEFKQRYLNQPYGDAWLLLRPLAYTVHPYRWATIGMEIGHIEGAVLDDVRNFFYRHYCPARAILAVAGAVQFDAVCALAEKWFGDITRTSDYVRNLPREPVQQARRELTVHRDVPADALYMAFHAPARTDAAFYATDLLSDILSRGRSSRLYNSLVKEKKLFSELSAYCTGDRDTSLMVVEGRLLPGIGARDAEREIWVELNRLKEEPVGEDELEKVKNKAESTLEFSEMDVASRALNLAMAEWLGDIGLVNRERELYRAVTPGAVQQAAHTLFADSNCSVLYYLKTNA
jgi:zinc protease